MSGRVFLANVGANTSHRFAGPLFSDGTFEFLPIPEERDTSGAHSLRYRDLRSHRAPRRDLLRFIPRLLWDWPAHNDPEFDTRTYGDNCDTSPRAAGLRRAEAGDFLFFIARLANWLEDRATRESGFYLIGYLEIESVLRQASAPPDAATMARFRHNAHVRRALGDPSLWNGFWVFAGSDRSRRFHRAVPATRELADRAFSRADGSPWLWDGRRSDLQVIGSYTRSCRCIIDPALPGHGGRSDALWDWVERHDPD